MSLKYPTRMKTIAFPKDEGNHPSAKWEWWYLQTHLVDKKGLKYSLMISFSKPDHKLLSMTSYRDKTYTRYRSDTEPFTTKEGRHDISFGSSWWKQVAPFKYSLHDESVTDDGRLMMDLEMTSKKPPLLVGGGFTPLGFGGHTYWYALTRVAVEGSLEIGGKYHEVKGLAWVDRQWGNWNWFGFGGWRWLAIQLDNGHDLMIGEIHEPGTRRSLTSFGHHVWPDGETTDIRGGKTRNTRFWRSEKTRTRYPVGWHIEATKPDLSLEVVPVFPEQEFEMNLWEGSCEVSGTLSGKKVQGQAFVETFLGIFAPVRSKAFSYARAALVDLWRGVGRGRR